MKIITGNYTNTVITTGRTLGAAKNNPGDNTGTGADKETLNDPMYGHLAVIESYKEGGNSNADETLLASDMRDAIEELTSKKVSGVDEWESTTTYTSEQLVMYKGFQFFAFNTTGNLAKPPLANPDYWMKSPTPEKLLDMFFEGDPQNGGMHNIANRSSSNYKQECLIGKYRLGGNGDDFYNFYRVALDGTQITGDANLEAIFDVGGSNEYFKLDEYAPLSGSTRTLIDMSSRHLAPQSSGGDNDTLGEVLEDRFQGHWHEAFFSDSGASGVPLKGTGSYANRQDMTVGDYGTQDPKSDGVNGTPRTGETTRPKEFTVGSSYIIVMIPA